MNIFGIIGAGGLGREVMPFARQMLAHRYKNGDFELVFVVENLPQNTLTNGYRTISDAEFIAGQVESKYFNVAISDSKTRERIANKLIADGIKPFSIFAPNNIIYEENIIEEGAIFCPFTIVTCNTKIGRFFQANTYSYVGHDCVIGDFVTFAPNVHCNGSVIIEDYAYIGTGAIIRQSTHEKPIIIGKSSTVGMGAVVTKSVNPFTTVVGNPAVELVK